MSKDLCARDHTTSKLVASRQKLIPPISLPLFGVGRSGKWRGKRIREGQGADVSSQYNIIQQAKEHLHNAGHCRYNGTPAISEIRPNHFFRIATHRLCCSGNLRL